MSRDKKGQDFNWNSEMSKLKKKEKALSLLSLSFDRNLKAESANKREIQKLKAEHQNLDFYRSEALRALCANEAKLRLNSRRLLEKRQTNLNKKFGAITASSLPDIRISKTHASLAADIQTRCLFKTELSYDDTCLRKDPSDCLSSSFRNDTKLKLPEIKHGKVSLTIEKAITKDTKSTNGIKQGFANPEKSDDSPNNCEGVETQKKTKRTERNLNKVKTLEPIRHSSRRRSLSLNDLSLAKRINAFLESVELAKNSSEENIDCL